MTEQPRESSEQENTPTPPGEKPGSSKALMALELAIALVCVLGFWRYQGDFSSVQGILIQIVLFLTLGAVCLSFIWRLHEGIKQKNPYQAWKEGRKKKKR